MQNDINILFILPLNHTNFSYKGLLLYFTNAMIIIVADVHLLYSFTFHLLHYVNCVYLQMLPDIFVLVTFWSSLYYIQHFASSYFFIFSCHLYLRTLCLLYIMFSVNYILAHSSFPVFASIIIIIIIIIIIVRVSWGFYFSLQR